MVGANGTEASENMSTDNHLHQRRHSPADPGDTQELRAHGGEPISAEEQRRRSRGCWMIACGAVVVILTFGIAIIWYAGFHEHIPTTLIVPLYGVGFGAVTLGSMEILNRPTRMAHQAALRRMEQIERGLLQLVDLLPDAMSDRWYAGYGEAARDLTSRRTGTNDLRAHVTGTAEVVDLRRRNDRH